MVRIWGSEEVRGRGWAVGSGTWGGGVVGCLGWRDRLCSVARPTLQCDETGFVSSLMVGSIEQAIAEPVAAWPS